MAHEVSPLTAAGPPAAPSGPSAIDLRRHQETTAVLGMTIFIASWAMLFASLFFSYAVTRMRAPYWPPLDLPALPRGLPALATVLIGAASFTLTRARRRQLAGTPVPRPLLLAALVGATTFLLCQLLLWRDAWTAGLRPQSGTYASAFYALTMFHGLHVLVGMLALLALVLRSRPADPTRGALGLRLWTLYFHMVAALWLVMFVGVFLL